MLEEELIRQLKNTKSRNRAFAELLTQYQERVYWHIRKIVLIHEDADDAVQNTFVKVFKNIDSFKGDSKLYTWIFRIATNESISLINKRKKKRVESIDSGDGAEVVKALKSDSFFSGDEITTNLMNAVATLPEKQRLVFQMKYFDDMPYKQIAGILGTSEGGLKASYHHATKKVLTQLKKIEFF
ncbi:sigma-70 family RNA polymerase sigma factor [Saprospiraceae bacterium]|nr:sigma-70 family RNA polymerase sigma factor [Saprospiraceae bacterium]